MMRAALVALVLLFSLAAHAGPSSFRASKTALMRVYADHRETFYCGCGFDADKQVEAEACGYVVEDEDDVRAYRIEWEHIVPASRLVARFGCTSRKACRSLEAFRRAEADPMNLVPAIGSLNAARRDYPYGDVPGEVRRWGACDFEVGDQVAEPAPHLWGDIARIWLYMDRHYGLELEDDEWWRLVTDASTDAPTEWERERMRRIRALR